MAEPITFPAQVVKVQTLADSGLRLTLDLPETEIVAFAWLAQCKRAGVVLNITAQPLHNNNEQFDAVETGPIRKSEGSAAEDAGAIRTFARRGQQNRRDRR